MTPPTGPSQSNDTDALGAGVTDRSQQLLGYGGCYGAHPNGLSI
jgi:hypothetical protein